MLQPKRRLCPNSAIGTSTWKWPYNSISGVFRWASYQIAGAEKPICGSPASIGLPLTVRLPAIAQALLPSNRGTAPTSRLTCAIRFRPAQSALDKEVARSLLARLGGCEPRSNTVR